MHAEASTAWGRGAHSPGSAAAPLQGARVPRPQARGSGPAVSLCSEVLWGAAGGRREVESIAAGVPGCPVGWRRL